MRVPFALVLRSEEVMLEIAKLDVVAFEVVALSAVKFWRVDEPFTRRLASVVNPEFAVRDPVKLAADEIV